MLGEPPLLFLLLSCPQGGPLPLCWLFVTLNLACKCFLPLSKVLFVAVFLLEQSSREQGQAIPTVTPIPPRVWHTVHFLAIFVQYITN